MAIDVRIESRATGGLRIIEHIPAVRPCHLEGKNGIGKSVAVRLLLLLSGSQPYVDDVAGWRSLRALIRDTRITLTGLTGPHRTARVQLTPDEWPDTPMPVGNWLGALTLDEEDVPMVSLFAQLRVVHLIGTERLNDTLSKQTLRVAEGVRAVNSRLNDLENERVRIGQIVERLADASGSAEDATVEALAGLRTERSALQHAVEQLTPKVSDLTNAVSLQAYIDNGDVDVHQQEVERLQAELKDARQQADAAAARHEAAVTALNRGNRDQKKAATLERSLAKLGTDLDNLAVKQESFAEFLEHLGVTPGVDRLSADDLELLRHEQARTQSVQRNARLSAARARRSAQENDVIDELGMVLRRAIVRGLGDLGIATLGREHVTVNDLLAGLGYVIDADTIDEREGVLAANRDVAQVNDLLALFEQRDTLKAKVDAKRQELEDLRDTLADHDDKVEEADLARDEVSAATARVRALSVQLGAKSRSGLGALAIEDMSARVSELLDKHRVDPNELGESLLQARTLVQQHRDRLEALSGRETDLLDSQARRRIDREALQQEAQQGGELSWLGDTFEALFPGLERATPWDDAHWEQLVQHVSVVRDALSQLFSDLAALEAAAATQGPSHGVGRSPIATALRVVNERHAVAQLSSQPIRDALFDGGTLQRVDLEHNSITWESLDGEIRTRPMSAFSSGEQAFGFIRAQLQQIAASPASNRIVFLDEFGAFIAADRRRPLAELLASDEIADLSSQIVVVLPLQADYEAELSQTTGTLREMYQRRAEDVTLHGYFAEALQ